MPGRRTSSADQHEIVHLHTLVEGQAELLRLAKAGNTLLRTIHQKVGLIVATLQEVKDQLASLKSDVEAERQQAADRAAAATAQIDSLAAEVQRLTDLINAGTAVTQADLDALSASIGEIDTAVKAIVPDAPTP